jgi:hypothetical protein
MPRQSLAMLAFVFAISPMAVLASEPADGWNKFEDGVKATFDNIGQSVENTAGKVAGELDDGATWIKGQFDSPPDSKTAPAPDTQPK